MKVLIEIPNTGLLPVETAAALMRMEKYANLKGIETECVFRRGCLIYDSREEAGKNLLESGCDALLFLDSDMYPTEEMLVRLANAKKDIISALAFRRVPNFEPCIFNEKGFYHDYPEGVIEVEAAGMACILIKREVFEKTPQPWFFPEPAIGEDKAFCRRVKKAGFKIYCDTTLECGHIGECVFHSGHYRQWREA
jgi:hypothetical protein